MRKIAYLAAIWVFFLAVANLAMSHALAGNGEYFSALTAKQNDVQQSIMVLEEEIMNARAISTIANRAQLLGLTQRVTQHLVQSIDVVSHP